MAKSLMGNIRAEMGKQDEKRGLAKLMSNVQEVQEVQEATVIKAEHLVRETQDVQDDTAVTNKHLMQKAQDVQQVQHVQYEQEVQGRNTQGRKGKKLPRAHISLSPEAYEYLSTMAGATRKTMSEYIENLLLEDKERTPSYPQIRELIRTMKGN